MQKSIILLLAGSMFLLTQCTIFSKQSSSSKSGKTPDLSCKNTTLVNAESDTGMITTHTKNDQLFLEIPDSVLNKEILLVTRLAASVNNFGMSGAGTKARSQQVIRWERRNDKILLRHVSYESTAEFEDPVYESVQRNNFEPVLHIFPIQECRKDSGAALIEVSSYFDTNPALFSAIDKQKKKKYSITGFDQGRSFIKNVKSFPENLEIRQVQTFKAEDPPANDASETLSLEVNHSMVMLPEKPMKRRQADKRVGYFSVKQYDYGTDKQKALRKEYITRWRLEPKNPEAYQNGELTEPKDPIVFYLDNATPKKWRQYIKQGVEDWQKAFEKAGFKNAIIAKDEPTEEEDSTFSAEDIRHSVIRYITYPVKNAMGPHVHDPRSGEILESDILWYHNVMNLLRNWYFVQTAAANPEARNVQMPDSVMGEMIRFVAAHEVGHSLGLPHNWGSSNAFPVDSLRSPSFTSTHGTAPSIMDYARFNYIAQPGDGVEDFMPSLGEYDNWSVEWGYRHFADSLTVDEEASILDSMALEKAGDPVYFYGRQTSSRIDPRSQNEDLGRNAMEASRLGIANLKRTIPEVQEWTYREGEFYEEMEELYGAIINQWNRYLGHVRRHVGGVHETFKTYEQEGPVFQPVPADRQKQAMDFLNNQAFTTPEWLMDSAVLRRIEHAGIIEKIRSIQVNTLEEVTSPRRIARLLEYEAFSPEEAYAADQMLDDLQQGVWREVYENEPVGITSRNLQLAYLEKMEALLEKDLSGIDPGGRTDITVSQSDIRPLVREQLINLETDIDDIMGNAMNRATRRHYQEVLYRIDKILRPDTK